MRLLLHAALLMVWTIAILGITAHYKRPGNGHFLPSIPALEVSLPNQTRPTTHTPTQEAYSFRKPSLKYLLASTSSKSVSLALFFLQQDTKKHPSCIPEGILMIVLVVITAGFHMILNDSYWTAFEELPLSLVDRESQDEVNNSEEDDLAKSTAVDVPGRLSTARAKALYPPSPLPVSDEDSPRYTESLSPMTSSTTNSWRCGNPPKIDNERGDSGPRDFTPPSSPSARHRVDTTRYPWIRRRGSERYSIERD